MFLHTVEILDMFPHTGDIHTAVSGHVETVALLVHQKSTEYFHVPYVVDAGTTPDNLPGRATYAEIKAWIHEHYDGMNVSSLYIAQVKAKHGLDKRENFNISKNPEAKVPVCPPDKEKAIEAALRHFRMIPQSEGLSESSSEQSEEK